MHWAPFYSLPYRYCYIAEVCAIKLSIVIRN